MSLPSLFSQSTMATVLREPTVTVFPARAGDRRRFVGWYRQEHAFRGAGDLAVKNAEAIARYLATAMRIPFVVERYSEHERKMDIVRPAV